MLEPTETSTRSVVSAFVNVSYTFGRQLVGGILNLLIIVLISRVLGAEATGAYALALLLPTVLSTALNLGIPSANVYYVATKRFQASEVWAATRGMTMAQGGVGVAVGAALVAIVGDLVFPGVDRSLLYVALALTPLMLMTANVLSLLQAREAFGAFNLVHALQPAISLAGLLLCLAIGTLTLNTVIVVVVLSHAVGLAVAGALLGRDIPLTAVPQRVDVYLRHALPYGLKAFLSNAMSVLVYRLDLFLINLFMGPTAAGLYTAAVRLVEQLFLMSAAASTVLLPRVAASRDEDPGQTLSTPLTPMLTRIVLWMTASAALMLSLVAAPLVVLLFGVEFSGSVTAIYILLPGVVLFSSSRVLANDFAARGEVMLNLMVSLVVLSVNAAGNLALIPRFGIAGAAWGTAIAYSIGLVARLLLVQPLIGVQWWQVLWFSPSDFRAMRSTAQSYLDRR